MAKHCGACGRQIKDTAKFCPYCGKPVGRASESPISDTPKKHCQNCGKAVPVSAKFCPYCQNSFVKPVETPWPPKSSPNRRVWVMTVVAVLILCAGNGVFVTIDNGLQSSRWSLKGSVPSIALPSAREEDTKLSGDASSTIPFQSEEEKSDHVEEVMPSEAPKTPKVVEGNEVDFEDVGLKEVVRDNCNLETGVLVTDRLCESVTELNCTGHTLTTLADLRYFPNIETLYVDNNGVELDLKGINKAMKLQSVTLRNCQLSEVDRIADLENLEYLDISTDSSWGTNVNDYSSLAALNNLKTLDMSWRGYNAYNPFYLTDASFIDSLTNLEQLNLSYAGIKDYNLGRLGHLRKLEIRECNVDEILGQLCESGAIHVLEYLDIGQGEYDRSITDVGLKNYLSQAENLRYLDININELTSLEGMGKLRNLEYLSLINGSAFDLPKSAYGELGKLDKVTEFIIQGNAPNVHENVNDLEITPDDYSFLSGMVSLKKGRLVSYEGMSVSSFCTLDRLESLTLWNGNIYHDDEMDISDIAEFAALREIHYAGIRFKSSAPLDDLDYLTVTEESRYDI